MVDFPASYKKLLQESTLFYILAYLLSDNINPETVFRARLKKTGAVRLLSLYYHSHALTTTDTQCCQAELQVPAHHLMGKGNDNSRPGTTDGMPQ